MTDHDDFCEAEYVAEAGGYTSCSCDYRQTRGLVAEHDRQVAERAWDDGSDHGYTYRLGEEHGLLTEEDTRGNPYRAAKEEQGNGQA